MATRIASPYQQRLRHQQHHQHRRRDKRPAYAAAFPKPLVCFVYDPDQRLTNSRGIETDLSKTTDGLDFVGGQESNSP